MIKMHIKTGSMSLIRDFKKQAETFSYWERESSVGGLSLEREEVAMCCVCDSGILVVLPILTALLLLAIVLLFYDFATPCDRDIVNSTVSQLVSRLSRLYG